jgi:hypothetical protein
LQTHEQRPISLPFEGGKMRTRIVPILLLMAALQACSAPVISKHIPTNSIPPLPSTNPAPEIMITVYFTNMPRYEVGTEPYEAAVTRMIPPPASLYEAVLNQLFQGPSDSEKSQGLAVVLSGTTGFSKLTFIDGVARVYLMGVCNSKGATYTIANLIFANLQQFPEVKWVKIYDQNGETETPAGQSSSIPICLEP